jgi:hypothetical protein
MIMMHCMFENSGNLEIIYLFSVFVCVYPFFCLGIWHFGQYIVQALLIYFSHFGTLL